jgi:hypothetical protein
MSNALALASVRETLFDAAARATLAPSIHNTQPWSFVVRENQLDLYADSERAVPVVDPDGRQRTISCGAALFGARAALAAAGIEALTTLVPDPADPSLVASVTAVGAVSGDDVQAIAEAARLDAAAELRHTNRRAFGPDLVPDEVIELLAHAALVEGAWLQPVTGLTDRVMMASLSQHAKELQNARTDYTAELHAWTSSDPSRRDGVPMSAAPHRSDEAHDDIPIRAFDTTGDGALPGETRSRLTQTLVVLGTAGDRLRDWLVVGQALDRVLLELTNRGYVASVLSQMIEEPLVREQLRSELRISGWPQLVLRIGVAEPTPATPRRIASDVIAMADPLVVGGYAQDRDGQ